MKKIRQIIAFILMFTILFSECNVNYIYASQSLNIEEIEDNSLDVELENDLDSENEDNVASTSDATDIKKVNKKEEVKSDTEDVKVLLDATSNDIELDVDDPSDYIIEETYKYGIQNTGTEAGILGAKLTLTLDNINTSDMRLQVDTNLGGYVLVEPYSEEVTDDGKLEVVYYLDTSYLESTDIAGYALRITTYATHSYKVTGMFSARLVAGIDDADSIWVFNEAEEGYSNLLNSDGTQENGIDFNGKVTVRFHTNGGSIVPSQVLNKGEVAVRPTDPHKTGYDFVTWELEGTEYDFNMEVLEDLILDATWEREQYEVNFDLNGGIGDYDTQTVYYEDLLGEVEDPVRDGYIFKGWYIGNKLWDFDVDQARPTYESNGVITLQARWEKIAFYDVKFVDKDNVNHVYATYRIQKGELVTEEVIPEKVGYKFIGWTEEVSGEAWDYPMPIMEHTRILANWERIIPEYTVTFDLDGGIVAEEIAVQTVKEGEKAVKPAIEPTKENFTFGGWYLGRSAYDFNTVVTSNLALKAKWNGRYTITFNLDGGEGDFPDITVNEGEPVTQPSTQPTKTGYKFKGWYYDDSRFVFNEGIHSNIELVAKWMAADAYEGRYAVSIYGIYEDVDASGNILGLTFGPAMSYTKLHFVRHEPEEDGAMCIHDMSWKDIIEQSKIDATVFQECLEHGCTKSVEFELRGTLSHPYQKITYANESDGDGYVSLNANYNKYTVNNQKISNAYAASGIRTILEGKNGETNISAVGDYALSSEESLVRMIPKDLGDHIISRQYDYYDVYNNTTNIKTMISKLWLFSVAEFYNTNFYYGTRYSYGEGHTYEKIERYNITSSDRSKLYLLQNPKANVSGRSTWLRTPYRYSSSGSINTSYYNSDTANVSPGFSLEGPDESDIAYRLQFNTNIDDANLRGEENLEDILVPYNLKVGDVVSELPMLYRENDYALMGWYVVPTGALRFPDKLSIFSHDYEVTLDTTVTGLLNCYARWGRPGYLKSANVLNSSINRYATEFKQSDTLTDKYNITDISQMTDETLYTWYDTEDNIQYWWSSTGKMIVENTAANMFYNKSLANIDLTNIDFSRVTDMHEMFENCTNLLNVTWDNKIDTSNVTNMNSMFYGCSKLVGLDLTRLKTYNVTSMSYMFSGCNSLQNLNISDFDTSKLLNMNYMFYNCSNLPYLDLSSFDTHKVLYMTYTFYNCKKLTKIDYSDNFVQGALTNLNYITTSNTTYSMFKSCPANKPYMWIEGKWSNIEDTSLPGTYVDGHLVRIYYKNSPNVIVPNVDYPTDYYEILWGHEIGDEGLPILVDKDGEYNFKCWNLSSSNYYDSLDILPDTIFNFTSDVKTLNRYIYTRSTYTEVYLYARWSNIGLAKSGKDWSINSSAYYFKYSEDFPDVSLNPIDVSYCEDRSVYTWYDSKDRIQYYWSKTGKAKLYDSAYRMFVSKSYMYDVNLTNIDFSRCLSMEEMFDGCTRLVNVTFGEDTDTSNLTNMTEMFYNCKALKDIDLSELNTEKVQLMSYMFYSCQSLTDVDISTFRTTQLLNMYAMFQGCNSLTRLDISNFDTPLLFNLSYAFKGCINLEYLDISSLDTTNVEYMVETFHNCSKLSKIIYGEKFICGQKLINLAYINSNNRTCMMFYNCIANKPISSWELGRWVDITETSVGGTYIYGHEVHIQYYNSDSPAISNLVLPKEYVVPWGYEIGEEAVPKIEDPNGVYLFDTWHTQRNSYTIDGINKDTRFTYTSSVTSSSYIVYHSISGTKTTVRVYAKWLSEGVSKTGPNIKPNINSSALYFKQAESVPSGVSTTDISLCGDRSVLTWYDSEKQTQWWWSSIGTMIIPGDASEMFYGKSSLQEIDLTNVDFSRVTDMSEMFRGDTRLLKVTFDKKVNTSKLINMEYMYYGCKNLTGVDMSLFDTSSVQNMRYMFQDCIALKSIDMSTWDMSSITNLVYMFYNCTSLTDVNITGWDVTNLLYTEYMFYACSSLTNISGLDWNASKLLNAQGMFSRCSSLESIDMSSFVTLNIQNTSYMFDGCSNLKTLDLSSFDTSNVLDMRYMFRNCNLLNKIVYGDNFVNSTLTYLNYIADSNKTYAMYHNCYANKPDTWTIGKWTNSNDTAYPGMYVQNHEIRIYYNQASSPVISNLKLPSYYRAVWGYPIGEEAIPDMSDPNNMYMFDGWNEQSGGYDLNRRITKDTVFSYTSRLNGNYMYHNVYSSYTEVYIYTKWVSEGVSKIGTYVNSKINSQAEKFVRSTTKPDDSLKPDDISICNDGSVLTWYDVANKTQWWWSSTGTMIIPGDASGLFYGKSRMLDIDLRYVDFSRVTTMYQMFYGCTSLRSVLYDTNINTSKLVNMSQMYYNCGNLSSVDMTKFNTSSVTDMSYVFYNNRSITSLDLRNWNVNNVTTLYSFVCGCSNLSSLNISNWNTTSLINMNYMFSGCAKLTSLDLSAWDTSKVESMTYLFSGCTGLTNIKYSNKFVDTNIKNLNYISSSNNTYAMFRNCKANRPVLWVDGRWVNEGDADLLGTYIKNHWVTIYYEPNLSGVSKPSNYRVLWGYPIGIEALPSLQDPNNMYAFDGWNEQRQDYSLNKRVTKDTIFKYTNSCTSDYRQYYVSGTSSSYYLYGKWVNEGVSKIGPVVRTKINDEAIKFVQSTSKPADSLNPIDISLCEDRSVLTWYNASNNTQYWWSSTGTMKIPGNASELFSYKTKMQDVDLRNVDFSSVTFMNNMFYKCTNLRSVIWDTNIDTSKVTTLKELFYECTNLKSVDMTKFNTSLVTDMSSIFYSTGLTSIDLSTWDTSSVTNMTCAFYSTGLTSLDLSAWNTSLVTTMGSMFAGSNALTTLNIKNFDTSKVTDLRYMFSGCNSLNNVTYGDKFSALHLNYLNYFSSSNPTYYMYYNCNTKPSHWTSGRWDTNGTYIDNLYYTLTYHKNYAKVQGVPDVTTKQIKWGYTLGAEELPSLVDTGGIYTFDGWYWIQNGYGNTQKIPLNSIVVTENKTLYARFRREDWTYSADMIGSLLRSKFGTGYTKFKQSTTIPAGVTTYDISECEDGSVLVYGSGDTIYWWGKHGRMILPSANRMFASFTNLVSVDLTNIDFSHVSDMESMFSECPNLTSINFGNINTSNVTNMSFLFDRCYALQTVDVSKFNTSKVTNMGRMFGDCRSLKSVTLTNFDTSKVTDMHGMFSSCSTLTSLSLKGFNTANVTTLLEMFDNCTNLTTLDISTFNTSKVKDFSHLFYKDVNLQSINYGSNFVETSGTKFEQMFKDATKAPKPPAWKNNWDSNGTYLD